MSNDHNVYVQGYYKNPGAQGGGLQQYAEISLGKPASPQFVLNASTATPGQNPLMTHGVKIDLASHPVPIKDTGGALGGQGSVALLTMFAGVYLIEPTFVGLAVQGESADQSGILRGAALIGSVGSAPAATDNSTLTGTEADIVASTACTLTAYAGTFIGIGPAPFVLDGSADLKTVYLNFAVPNSGIVGDDTLLLSGYIRFAWRQVS